MEENRYRYRHNHVHVHRPSIFWPLILIAVGVVLLLNVFHLIPVSGWDLIWRLWPALFIVGGLDGLYRRDGFVGPLVSIGLGTVILLGNLGYLSASSWTLLLRFWPLFLIAIGLDLLIGRRSALSAVIGLAVGLVLIAGIAWAAVNLTGPRGDFRSEPVRQSLGTVKSADVKIDAVAADLSLAGGAGSQNLLEGDLQLAGNERSRSNYSVSGDRAHYELGLENNFYVSPFAVRTDQTRWNLKLTDAVPVRLETNAVFGRQTVDLSGVEVEGLKSDTVFGQTALVLPAAALETASGTQIDASVVFGELVVRIPRGADLVIEGDTAFTGASLPDGFVRENGRIYSPNASRSASPDLKVSILFGSLKVEVQ